MFRRGHPRGKGVLDLFSGSEGWADSMLQQGAPWVLSYDLLRDPDAQDLSKRSVQKEIEALLEAGAFAIVGSGIVCSSFSSAVTPPVRSSEFLRSLPYISANMSVKVSLGI